LPRIIVTFAVRAELAPFRRLNTSKGVRPVVTGIGARNMQTELQQSLSEGADLCVASGLAGSLKREHVVGTILVASAVRRGGTSTVMRSDSSLLKVAVECGATPVEYFYTADTVANSVSEKVRLGETADAIEMESFQILAEAHRHGVPAVAIRAVSDSVDRDMPLDFNRAIGKNGEIGMLRALQQVVAAPSRLPQLVRFGFESARAARKLARFLDRYLRCLGADADWQFNIRRMESR
jgi:adenosylhomocysteine nucleosidase